ncbi:hypothetical protein L9F63_021889, partial [Diploptera punctata]
SPAMMGLQVTASKRKLQDVQAPQPAKLGRTDETVRDAVVDVATAPDLDAWRVDSTSSMLASTLLGSSTQTDLIEDDDDDDDDDDDEEDEEEEKNWEVPASGEKLSVCETVELKPVGYYGTEEQVGYPAGGQYGVSRQQQQQHYQPRSVSPYWGTPPVSDSSAVEYYGQDASPQQTIRCDENGKSYLDLGSSSARYNSAKCCDGSRTSWCSQGPNTACYRQRRLAVLNISMCKLGRYRQFLIRVFIDLY